MQLISDATLRAVKHKAFGVFLSGTHPDSSGIFATSISDTNQCPRSPASHPEQRCWPGPRLSRLLHLTEGVEDAGGCDEVVQLGHVPQGLALPLAGKSALWGKGSRVAGENLEMHRYKHN